MPEEAPYDLYGLSGLTGQLISVPVGFESRKKT